MRTRLAALAFVAVILGPNPANAATIQWNAAVDGVFNDTTKWNPASVPGANDDTVLDQNGTYSVTMGSNLAGDVSPRQIKSLDVRNGTVTLNLFKTAPFPNPPVLRRLQVSDGAVVRNGTLKVVGPTIINPPEALVTKNMDIQQGGTLQLGNLQTDVPPIRSVKWRNTGDLKVGVDATDALLLVTNSDLVTEGKTFVGTNAVAGGNRGVAVILTAVGRTPTWTARDDITLGENTPRSETYQVILSTVTGKINAVDRTGGKKSVFIQRSSVVNAAKNAINARLVRNGGDLNIGASPGKLVLTADYEQTSEGALSIELGGLVRGIGYDHLRVAGDVSILDGILDLSLVDGFVPVPGDHFTILRTTGVFSGSFTLPGDPTPLVDGSTFILEDEVAGPIPFRIRYRDHGASGSSVVLNVPIVPEPVLAPAVGVGLLCLARRRPSARSTARRA